MYLTRNILKNQIPHIIHSHTHHILHTTKEQMTKRAAEKQIIKDGPNDDDDDGDVEQQSAQDTVDLSQRK